MSHQTDSTDACGTRQHESRLATCAASADARCRRQRGLAIRLSEPRHLEHLRSHPGTELGLWRNTGVLPRLSLLWDKPKPLRAGWYVLEIRMQALSGQTAVPKLYLDHGDGFREAHSVRLALTPNALRHRVLLRLAHPTHAARLQPEPTFEAEDLFVLDSRLSLHRIGRPQAMLRLGLPAVARMRASGSGWGNVLHECLRALRRGPGAALATLQANTEPGTGSARMAYARWVALHDTLDHKARRRIRGSLAGIVDPPTISVVVPVHDTAETWLRRSIESVRQQLYPHWQLCLANDASTAGHVRAVLDAYQAADHRIQVVHRADNGGIAAATNSALRLATCDWVAFLDHDDELPEHALFHVAMAIRKHPEARLLYSDEDKIDEQGRRFDPYFKPDWNPELFLGQNMITHLGVYQRALLDSIGGFRDGFEGSQDHDLALRYVERIRPEAIHHIPRVLYHWRAVKGSTAAAPDEKLYAHDAGLRAIREHLDRRHIKAEVSRCANHYYRTRYELPSRPPKVSLIVPTRDRVELLQMSVGSMLKVTDYPDFELLIVDNQSHEQRTLEWFDEITARDTRVRILAHDKPFNFARINNDAVAHCDGEIIVLVNNDIEATHADWLTEMTSHAVRDGVGAVGAKLYYPDGTIQHAGVILGIGGVAGHAWCRKPHDYPGQMSRALLVQNLSAVTGACLAVKKSAYLEVGGMNEDLQVAFNDIDFCLRLLRAGYENIWTPHAELIHHESASRGYEDTPEKLARFHAEMRKMQAIWGDTLLHDPAYNPNLTLSGEPFAMARDPRVPEHTCAQ